LFEAQQNADYDTNLPAIDAACRREARIAALLASPSSAIKDFTRLRAMPLPRRIAVRLRQAQNLARRLGRRLRATNRIGGSGGGSADRLSSSATRHMLAASAAASAEATRDDALPSTKTREQKVAPATAPLWSALWAPASWTSWYRANGKRQGGGGARNAAGASALAGGLRPARRTSPGARIVAP
jgi:hypothetical protein